MIDAVWINGKSVLVSTIESAFMERDTLRKRIGELDDELSDIADARNDCREERHRYLKALEEIASNPCRVSKRSPCRCNPCIATTVLKYVNSSDKGDTVQVVTNGDKCGTCKNTGMYSELHDGGAVEIYCDCLVGQERLEKEQCIHCGEREECCICPTV
jgi:hypothetical protein